LRAGGKDDNDITLVTGLEGPLYRLVARRIVTDAVEGDRVRQGERLGLIRFGSRVDTFLPAGARPRVREGERTRAGVTVIGEWP